MAFGGVFGKILRPAFDAGLATALVPYSLSYDGSDDETDCGTGASVLGLNAGAFTIDLYCQPVAPTVWNVDAMLSQGDMRAAYAGTQGWALGVEDNGSATAFRFWFALYNGGIVNKLNPALATLAYGAWYYVRVHCNGGGAGKTFYISYNAGTELNNAKWGVDTTSAYNLYHGRRGGATHNHYKGNICYIHLWNIDKGPLAAVPTSPFAVDANTVGRWIHSDGAGATLTDTSGNANNGTISGAAWSATVPAGWTI